MAERSRKSSGREPIPDVRPEPYLSFRLRHKFSLMVVGPSMLGKRYFVEELLEIEITSNTRITGNIEKYTGFMDIIKICLRT